MTSRRYHTVVRGKRPKKTVTRTKLEDVELVRIPGTFGEPFRVVQTLPGVSRTPFGMSFLIVRGANPEDSAFLLDGFLLPDLYHFLAGPALINAELVETIEFYPGNYPVRYGWRQAGLVVAETRDEWPRDRVRGNVSLDLLDLEGIVHVPVGETGQVSVAGRHSHFGPLIELVTDDTLRPHYWDYQPLVPAADGGHGGALHGLARAGHQLLLQQLPGPGGAGAGHRDGGAGRGGGGL